MRCADGSKMLNGKDLDPHNKQHWSGVVKMFSSTVSDELKKRIDAGEAHLKATYALPFPLSPLSPPPLSVLLRPSPSLPLPFALPSPLPFTDAVPTPLPFLRYAIIVVFTAYLDSWLRDRDDERVRPRPLLTLCPVPFREATAPRI